jgi:hypothetical protein
MQYFLKREAIKTELELAMSHSVSRYLRTEEQSFNNFAQRNQIVILETRMSPRARCATKCSVFLGTDSMINQAEQRLPPDEKGASLLQQA